MTTLIQTDHSTLDGITATVRLTVDNQTHVVTLNLAHGTADGTDEAKRAIVAYQLECDVAGLDDRLGAHPIDRYLVIGVLEDIETAIQRRRRQG